jgi:S-adenosylmethionine hydrolase
MRCLTLLTDFGTRDHFVGVMKGVIAGIAPRATVIDICHEVAPYQINQARFLLNHSYRWFPKGTIHVCVVDPGVGSARRPLLVEAAGHLFVGPDNGLFSDLLDLPKAKVRHLSNAKLYLNNISQTFHGRDIFAPVAAHLAAGVTPAKAGKLIHDATRTTTGAPLRVGRRYWQGEVAHIDRFGNLITNLNAAEFLALAAKGIELKIGFTAVRRLVNSYSEAPPGEPVLITGSCNTLEVIIQQDSAARSLGVGIGAPVELEVY